MDYNGLIQELEQGKISPYQIYNLDIDYPQFFAVDHYLRNPEDNIDKNQKTHKLFLDIEVYSDNKFDFDRLEMGEHPISSCALLSTHENKFYCFFLLLNKNVETWKQFNGDIKEYLKKKLKDDEYGDYEIELTTYTNDLPLLKAVWEKIHELDPVVISGFNSDGFDFPYIYYRLKHLYNGDTKSISKILSRFGNVTCNNFGGGGHKVRFIEYVNADFSYLYRLREDGGLGFGRKQPSYSLDFISKAELKFGKVDYKKEDTNLDEFYINDPVNYLFYNIIDVWLVDRLENKMKIIDQYNMYRRLMKTPIDIGLRGPTVLFDTLVYNQLSKDKKYIRFGINDETIMEISKTEIEKIPKPLSNRKIKWNVNSIDARTYLKITRKFEGAYVKSSPGKIYDSSDGLIIDLDASRLYPLVMVALKSNLKMKIL